MAFYNTQLFPPVIPPNIPAYDGTQTLRVYFQMSVANAREQINHIQIIINRLDSNLNALNTVNYPMGIIFVKNQGIFLDTTMGMYYLDLPANLLTLDKLYKLQIRAGLQDLDAVGNTIQNSVWLNTPAMYDQFSEWSTVCIIKPITIPLFDMVGFTSKVNGVYVEPIYITDNIVNVANTPGFLFAGSYAAQDPLKEEKINSYEFTLYEDNGTTIEASWRVIDKSGIKYIGQYEATNIQFSFDYVLEKTKTYYVKFTVNSRNGYTESKIYKTLVMYAEVNLYNTFHVTPNQDLAKISLHVEGKQLLFVPNTNTIVEPMMDATVSPSILQTHMIVQGTIKESRNLDFYAIDGTWVVQMRAMGIKPLPSKVAALRNPILLLEENPIVVGGPYQKIKLCAVKQLISFPREVTPRYLNDFYLVKEIWKNNVLLFSQEKMISLATVGVVVNASDFIGPMNEYYFYIKEDNGRMEFTAQKLRTSTNTEIATYANNYIYN